MENQKIDFIALEKLRLDNNNPRLPVNYQDATEDEIIRWMLEDASIIELMLAIGQNDFFIGEALLVVKNANNYVVVEGNRRLTSLKLLQNPLLASIHTQKIQQVLEETSKRPVSIPCIVFPSRELIMKYLGYRHITGIKAWGMFAKAKHLNNLLPTLETTGLENQSKELAKKIGSRSDYVKRMLISYRIYAVIQDNGFYQIPKLNDTTFYFNYIADSLRYKHIRKFIAVNLETNIFSETDLKLDNLKELIHWFFEKNNQNKSRVLGDSSGLTMLNKVLSNPEITAKFIGGMPLSDAVDLIEVDSGTFTQGLNEALQKLKTTHGYVHKIKLHNNIDIETLKEIVDICKIIRGSITNKSDDWSVDN